VIVETENIFKRMLKLDKFFKKFLRSQLAELSTPAAKISLPNFTDNKPTSSNCPITTLSPVHTDGNI
jgi:hypothetical protein